MKCSPSHIAKGPRAGGICGIELHTVYPHLCKGKKKDYIDNIDTTSKLV